MSINAFSSKQYDNLLKVGATAKEIETYGEAEGWNKLLANRKLKKLSVSYLAQDQAARLSELKSLQSLHIFNGLVNDLSSLTELAQLRHLKLEVTGYVRDFSFLGRLKQLETLKLIDVTKFKDVSILEKLPLLHTFQISKMTSWVSLPTLASFAKLKQVRVLRIGFDAKDGSLSPLGKLSDLEELSLPLSYYLEEYARLAVALPHVKCSCFTQPYNLAGGSVFSKCKRCGGFARITLARGRRSICSKCDDDKFRAYKKNFEDMKAEFSRKAAKK